MPKPSDAPKQNVSFRFDPGQREALEKIAKRNGVEVSQLIRWAIDALIAHVERSGGRLLLPIDFGETFQVTPAEENKQDRGGGKKTA